MTVQQSGEPTWPLVIQSISELIAYWSTPKQLRGYDLREAIFETFSTGLGRRFPFGGYGFRLLEFAYPSPPPMVNEGRFVIACLEQAFPRAARPPELEHRRSYPALEASRWQTVDAALDQFLDTWLYSPASYFRIPPDNPDFIPHEARPALLAPWAQCCAELAAHPEARGMLLFGELFENVEWSDGGSVLALRSASTLYFLVASWVTD